MTIVVLVADAPVEGVACRELLEDTSLSPAEGVDLYKAVLKDSFETLAASNADVLVNYPAADDVPEEITQQPEAILRSLAASVLDPDTLDDVRFEVQVGSNTSAVVGNAITHLLRDEDRTSATFLRPCVPRLERSIVDEASIKLRRSDVVLGPAADGEVYLAGFREPIDYTDVLEERAIEDIVRAAQAEEYTVDFLRDREVLTTGRDLRTVVSRLRAAHAAGKPVPTHLWEFIESRDVRVLDGEIVVGEGEATDSS
ncbi:MAG: DUF2064 domain-containing protein [Halodesulfurarchaeum sp.]